ncbi:MAG: hypothetical protein Ct9H300mP25_09880 [Acidobacteriota bacterium]|nr:MAG: hypothetical protein Ct9H300mP25_09880 [Acidobacteriota bacterium]
MLAYFLENLRKTSDGDANLLDNSMIVYGGGIGNGNFTSTRIFHAWWPVVEVGVSMPDGIVITKTIRRMQTCCYQFSTKQVCRQIN